MPLLTLSVIFVQVARSTVPITSVRTDLLGPGNSVEQKNNRKNKISWSLSVSAKSKSARRNLRRRYLASLLAGSLFAFTGCSSMSGGSGWWSSTGGSVYGAGTTAAKGVGGQFKSMGTTVSNAYGKTKAAVVSTFKPGSTGVASDKDDPTSLASMPGKLTPDIWVMQGQLAESQGQHAKALESYNKALQSEPNNVGALVSTARLYDRQGDSTHSVQFFQRALALNPNDASIHNDLGLAYSKAGNAAASKDSLGKATAIEPSNVRYRNNLATVMVENGQADEAVNQLQQVLPPAVAHYNVAYLHFTKQNLPAAQQQLQAALQIDPNLQQARELYNRIGGGQAVAQATNAYQMAGNIYQTAQGFANPNGVDAVPASAQSSSVVPNTVSAPPPAWLSTPAAAPTR
jgi:Tfp pilus assembly protein PilF